MTKIRRTIARRLQHSKQTLPHFYVGVDVDMTGLVELRKKLKSEGYALTVNDFIAKAVSLTLAEFPAVNSSTEDGVHVAWHSNVNLGIAVSIDAGLVVPVLRNADRMSLDELHDVARELAEKAREGKLTPAEMEGGTFTLSNMGMLKVDEFIAIINPGEGAILAVSTAKPTAVVNDEREIVVRDVMRMTLSADHRIIDGALGALFVNAVKSKLEDVGLWEQELGLS
jgi:pyruvate dehydrogenase E2 component (dihydrolipoamide acetyltransferase)